MPTLRSLHGCAPIQWMMAAPSGPSWRPKRSNTPCEQPVPRTLSIATA